MPLIGQCAICYSSLLSSETYAIKTCGHTFHEKCAKQWLKQGKCCSSCRTKATENDVMKLYIQESGMNDTFASQNMAVEQLAETERKYEELANTHKKTQEDKNRMEADNRKLNKIVTQLQKEVDNVPLLRAQLNSLEDAFHNSQVTEKKLKEVQQQLKASTFYELLTSKGKTEEEYKKFVDSNGVINGDAFLAQSRKENKKLKKQLEESRDAQKKLEKDYEAERKMSLQRKDAIVKLTAEVKALREAATKKNDPPTPDSRLVNILNHSPPSTSRKSLGFSFESPVFPRSVVESAVPPKKAKKRVFIDDEDDSEEENVPPAKVSNKKKSPPKKLQKKAFTFSSSDEEDEDGGSYNPSNRDASFNVPAAVPRFTRQTSSNKNLGSKFGTTLSDKRPAVEKITAAAAKAQKVSDAVPATKKAAVVKPKKLTVTRNATAPKTQKVSKAPADDSIICLD